jgi:hypothetical protein
MTVSAHSEPILPRALEFFGDQRHRQSDDLFVVTVWSVVGVTLAALSIWLGLGGQIDSLIGLG